MIKLNLRAYCSSIILKRKGAGWLPFLFILLISQICFAQMNLSGKSGLLYIPDALEISDGTFRVGFNYNPDQYGLRSLGENSERILFANLTIVPRLDVSISFLQMISSKEYKVKEALGDRQLDVRYLLLRETRNRPSLAFVLSSPFTISAAMLTQAVVASKHVKLNQDLKLILTVGYGSPYFLYRDESNLTNSNIFSNFKWQRKSEYLYNNGYLTGPFAGFKLDYQKKVGIMAEWDSQKLNIGAYGVIGKRWTVQAGLLNFDQVMFGSSFAVDLFKPTRKIEKLYE